TVVAAVTSLASVIAIKYATTAIPKAIKAIKLMTAAQLKLNAQIAIVAIGIGFVIQRLTKYNSEMKKIGDTLRMIDEDTKNIPIIFRRITSTQRELNALSRAIAITRERGFKASETQVAQVEKLEKTLARLRAEVDENNRTAAEEKAAQDKAKASRDANLETVTRQKELLEKILKPMKDFIELQADLNVLVDQGSINQKKANELIEKGRPKEKKAAKVKEEKDPFKEQIKSLRELNEELKIRANNTSTAREGLLLELKLTRAGVIIDEDKREILSTLVLEKKRFNDELDRQKRKEDQLKKIAEENKRIEELKKEIDVIGQLKIAEQELIDLQNKQKDVVIPGLQEAVQDLRLRQLDASNELADGFTRAFARIAQEAEDLAAVGEAVVNVFADNATDALVEFTR
ncbi:hypothetical protein LCGC14_2827510, partial [marine sediment metagenome]